MNAPPSPVGLRQPRSSRLRGRLSRTLMWTALAVAIFSGACGSRSEEEGEPHGDGDGDSGGTTSGGGNGDGDGDTESGGRANGDGDGDGACALGSEGCECYGNGTCNGSLSCLSNLCVDAGGDGDGDGDGMGGVFGDGDGTGGLVGDGDIGIGGSAPECDCEADEVCVDNDCVAQVCSPDEPACDGNWARWCNAAGTGYVPGGIVCDSDESCDAGVCKEQICTPGATSCQAGDVLLCAENGLAWTIAESCQDQACIENDGSAACEGVCGPGQSRCSDNGIETCNDDGEWTPPQACIDQTCFDGSGSAACEGVCAPGQKQCSDNSVQTCSSGQWGGDASCVDRTCIERGDSASCEGVCAGVDSYVQGPGDTYAQGDTVIATCDGGTLCAELIDGEQYEFTCLDQYNCGTQNPGTSIWVDPPWDVVRPCD